MKPLALFFIATFAWTWSFYAPIAVGGHSPYVMPWLALLIAGGAGPSIIGVALLLVSGRESWQGLLRRALSPRPIPIRVWIVVLLLGPLVYAAAAGLDVAMGGVWPGAQKLQVLTLSPLGWFPMIFISFMSGPWSEEFGWRGYALDGLLQSFGPLGASTLLGLAWGLWHLPLYFMAGTWHAATGLGPAGFGAFVAGDVGLSLIMTWAYLASSRSILTALLIHFAANASAQLLAPVSTAVEVGVSVAYLMIGLALVLPNRDRRTAPV
jgi:membrane protease YdiL (CAAX protease family)